MREIKVRQLSPLANSKNNYFCHSSSRRSAKLARAILREVIRWWHLFQPDNFFVFSTIKNSAAEICRARPSCPSTFEASQSITTRLESGPRPEIQPAQSPRREVFERVPEQSERRAHFVAEFAECAQVEIANIAPDIPQNHSDSHAFLRCLECNEAWDGQLA